MTNEEIRAAIAKSRGFSHIMEYSDGQWIGSYNHVSSEVVPDYCNDLNAMHEVEKALKPTQQEGFQGRLLFSQTVEVNRLEYVESQMVFQAINATAYRRAKAYVQTIGKWIEPQP